MKKVRQGQTRWFGGCVGEGKYGEGKYVVVPAFVVKVSGKEVTYRVEGRLYKERAIAFLFFYRQTYRAACRARDELMEMHGVRAR